MVQRSFWWLLWADEMRSFPAAVSPTSGSTVPPCPVFGSAPSPSSCSPGQRQESLRRRSGPSALGGGTACSRADAFHLSPGTLRRLARTEQLHDLAMTSLLGEQVGAGAVG